MKSIFFRLKIIIFCFFAVLNTSTTESAAENLNSNQINKIIKSLAPVRGDEKQILQSGSDDSTTCYNVFKGAYYDLPDVLFEFDRFSLTSNAKQTLDLVASALNSSELKDYSYLVAGFTDATGQFDYNLSLSKQRAISVTSYLVTEAGVNHMRLLSAGFGETNLRDVSAPASPVNRRVTLVLLDATRPTCN